MLCEFVSERTSPIASFKLFKAVSCLSCWLLFSEDLPTCSNTRPRSQTQPQPRVNRARRSVLDFFADHLMTVSGHWSSGRRTIGSCIAARRTRRVTSVTSAKRSSRPKDRSESSGWVTPMPAFTLAQVRPRLNFIRKPNLASWKTCTLKLASLWSMLQTRTHLITHLNRAACFTRVKSTALFFTSVITCL